MAAKTRLKSNYPLPVSAGGTGSTTGSMLSGRNRIINGDCRVVQRPPYVAANNGISGFGGPDRFKATNVTAGGQFTQDVGSINDNGITKRTVRQTVNQIATDFSGAKYWSGIHQGIEGYNVYDLATKPITVSFLFLASVSGTYSVAIRDSNGTNSYVTTFAAVANVLQRVVVNVPAAPTPLTIPNDNTAGMLITVGCQGSTQWSTTTLNAWQAGNFNTYAGVQQWALTAGASIQLTDLQVEEGSVATPFERLQYGTVVALCQRYYEAGYQPASYLGGGLTGSNAYGDLTFMVLKRASPTITATAWRYYSGTNDAPFTPVMSGSPTKLSWTSGTLANWNGWTGTGTWTAEAEL